VLALVALGACFANPDFRSAVWATAAFLAAAIVYFVLYSRTRLVAQAPEEAVALERAAAALSAAE
jgi:ethanolamine permease